MNQEAVTLRIEGMSCDHCIKTVRSALEKTPDVEVIEVEIGSARILVGGNREVVDAARQSVDDTGFEVVGVEPE
jgi:copper chaperone CopZ